MDETDLESIKLAEVLARQFEENLLDEFERKDLWDEFLTDERRLQHETRARESGGKNRWQDHWLQGRAL